MTLLRLNKKEFFWKTLTGFSWMALYRIHELSYSHLNFHHFSRFLCLVVLVFHLVGPICLYCLSYWQLIRSWSFCTKTFLRSYLTVMKREFFFYQYICGKWFILFYILIKRKCIHTFTKRFVWISNEFLQYLNKTCVAHILVLRCKIQGEQ